MTALLALEFEPEAAPHYAVNALRHPALVVRALDVGRHEVVATVEVESGEALEAVVTAVRSCRGVRASTAFTADA
jgi:hypothetical protein